MNAFVRHLAVAGAGAALMVVAGAPAGAQSGAQSQGSTADNSTQPQRTIQMVPVLASLDHTLDAKKAKQGEPVTAKLQKDVQIPQQRLCPRTRCWKGTWIRCRLRSTRAIRRWW